MLLQRCSVGSLCLKGPGYAEPSQALVEHAHSKYSQKGDHKRPKLVTAKVVLKYLLLAPWQ